MEEIDESSSPAAHLSSCKICGRNFNPDVLKKHVSFCEKSKTKRRKVFDSSRQRAEGTDISTLKPVKSIPEPPKSQSDWRRKHEEFITSLRAARAMKAAVKGGGPLPPPLPPTYNPDYIQCPHCQRRFNESAADRHIKFCKDQASRIANKGKTASNDKAKPITRTQYKPPPSKASTVSSRLPQRSNCPPAASPGTLSFKSSMRSNTSTNSSLRNTSSELTSSSSEVAIKPKGSMTPSFGGKNSSGINRKVVHNTDNLISRNNMKTERSLNCSTDGCKFCHMCGTKHPVDLAKFCYECGVRQMHI